MDQNKYYRNDPDLRFAVLTPEQEKNLFAQMHGTDAEKAKEARDFLIENHLLFAQTEAKKIAKDRLPHDEVVSAANYALMKCIDKFSPLHGARFTTYFRFYLRAAISEIWQQKDPVNYKRRYPTGDALDPQGGRWSDRVLTPLEEQIEVPDPAGDEFKKIALGLLDKFRNTLTEEEQEFLRKVYEDNQSFAEIGRMRTPPVSREAIRTQHDRILVKLRKKMLKSPELK